MLFRVYCYLAKLSALSVVLFGAALGFVGFAPPDVVKTCVAAASLCFLPYLLFRLAMQRMRPRLACPLCGDAVEWNNEALGRRLDCARCGRVIGPGPFEWRFCVAPPAPPPPAVTCREWLPEPFALNISEDFVPAFRERERQILETLREVRRKNNLPVKLRVRDDPLLAEGRYDVVVNGHRVRGCTLGPDDDIEAHLAATVDAVCREYGEAIRFFADQYAAAPPQLESATEAV